MQNRTVVPVAALAVPFKKYLGAVSHALLACSLLLPACTRKPAPEGAATAGAAAPEKKGVAATFPAPDSDQAGKGRTQVPPGLAKGNNHSASRAAGRSRGASCKWEPPPLPIGSPLLEARLNPISTFSIDVDTAAYAMVRRSLAGNRLPPAASVRMEELINYFDYDYPHPTGDEPFSITTEAASTPWNPGTRLVHVGLQGAALRNTDLPAANLVFLIDMGVSRDAPERLPVVKRALRQLIAQLRPKDRAAIAAYAGAAAPSLPSMPGSEKAALLEAVERLDAGTSIAGAAGIVIAYETVKRHFIKGGDNRVVLMTDGGLNLGVSGDTVLVRMIEENRKSGVFLSVLGFGKGAYQDDRLERLADKGNGDYAHIANVREARKVLVAKDVKVQVEFNPVKVKAYRLIGFENRVLRTGDFDDDARKGDGLGAGQSVTALYEVVPAGRDSGVPEADSHEHRDPVPPVEDRGELLTVKIRYKGPDGAQSRLITRAVDDVEARWERASEDFRFSAAVAGFGMLLRGSGHTGDLEYAQVLAMAQGSQGADSLGHRAEFMRLVEAARLLAATERSGTHGRED